MATKYITRQGQGKGKEQGQDTACSTDKIILKFTSKNLLTFNCRNTQHSTPQDDTRQDSIRQGSTKHY
jgi:hypothetical protein